MVGILDVGSDADNTALYASELPPGTVCVFWKDLVAGIGADQGIYYQIDVYGVDSQLSVEYILTAYTNSSQFYHVILVYDTDAAGLVEMYYFADGDGGAGATIGAQGYDEADNVEFVTYDYDTPNTVAAADKVDLTTNLNDNPSGTYSLHTFVIDCYPPGTWPTGTC